MCVFNGAEFAVYDRTVSPGRIKRDCGIGVISSKSFSYLTEARYGAVDVGLADVTVCDKPDHVALGGCRTNLVVCKKIDPFLRTAASFQYATSRCS